MVHRSCLYRALMVPLSYIRSWLYRAYIEPIVVPSWSLYRARKASAEKKLRQIQLISSLASQKCACIQMKSRSWKKYSESIYLWPSFTDYTIQRVSFSQGLLTFRIFLFLFLVTRVDTTLEICSEEEIEFHCPPRDQAIKSNQYQSLLWSVFDPMNPSTKRENIFYCGQNPVNCQTYKLSSYDGRISVRSPVPGKLFLKHLTKNDLLTYTCQIQLKDINLDRLVYRVNISSSVYCKF